MVNKAKKKNGSSIIRTDTNKVLNDFFQALALHLEKNISFDYYTSVKINRFINKLSSVTQGINIKSVMKKQPQKDINGNKLPSIVVINDINENIIKKIKTELWLKERVFHYGNIENLNFPSAKLVLFFVRKLKTKDVYVSVVNIMTNENGITITKHERYATHDEGKLIYDYPCLKSAFPSNTDSYFKAMYNQSFFIYDTIKQKLLISYHSGAIPNLIGNSAFDNVEKSQLPNGINRERYPEDCVLPYYINPTMQKQLNHIFLEDCGENGVKYFVSKKEQPRAKIVKQNLMQNILVFNSNGSKALPLNEELTALFLQSFTLDILNNGEVSKKSIFQKIAELYLEN